MTKELLDSLPIRNVLGVPVHSVSMEQAIELCDQTIASRDRLMIGVVNAAKLVKMRDNELLRDSVTGSDLIVADGMAIVWASKILGEPLPGRVTGIDLFEQLLALADRKQLSVYLLGAAADVLDELVRRIQDRLPGVRIAGRHDGYFSDDEAAGIATEISAAKPDMLFVGITTPKKELFLEAYGPELDVSVCHGVGGSFDVMAGKTSRAPEAWQRLGIEWLWRVVQEPRRMWKRYLVTNTQFIVLVAREWWGKRRQGGGEHR